MKKKTILGFLFFIILFTSFTYFNSLGSSLKDVTKVENFTLKDYNGKSHSLSDYKKSKAIVIMFISTECAVSNAYNKRM